jgi:hypothetical protein
MLYQDRLGMLYEIPDGQVYGLGYADPYGPAEGQMLYDGLGNPVGGWFDSIAKAVGGLVGKALPVVSSFIPGGPLINQALPAIAQGLAPGAPAPMPAAPAVPAPVPAPMPLVGPMPPVPVPGAMPPMPGAFPPFPGMPSGMMPGMPGMPMPRPWPLGWVRPSLPYTGLGPNRLYMRCAVWPGPEGLVPAMAAQAPAATAQAASAAAAQTASALMRRRRHPRRR